jgi:hypothetical protein
MTVGKVTRFSIIHCIPNNGLLEKSLFVSINNEINSEIFENWLKTKLLPQLQ